MITGRCAALLIGVMALSSACQSKEEKARVETLALRARVQRLQARLAKADRVQSAKQPVAMWIMPPVLHEISGLALTDDGRLLAHDDELARIFVIDPKQGVITKSFMLGKGLHGDFEAITTVGKEIYLLLSNGEIYQFQEGANQATVPYKVYDTHLGKECEFEGLAYEKDSSALVLPCKHVHKKHLEDELVMYRWKIGSTDTTGISMQTIPMEQVIGSNKWKKFRPSDITVDPATGNFVMISSLDHGLVVMTSDGEVVKSEPLPGKHAQAEGVAITRDNILIISDEATSKPAAITLYRWTKAESGAKSQ
jgi:uncharacterized protein YjiK